MSYHHLTISERIRIEVLSIDKNEKPQEKYIRRERYVGEMQRSFTLMILMKKISKLPIKMVS